MSLQAQSIHSGESCSCKGRGHADKGAWTRGVEGSLFSRKGDMEILMVDDAPVSALEGT
jgi:hypothetical protein